MHKKLSPITTWLRRTFVVPVQATPMRITTLGMMMALGNPFFGWLWTKVLPQPYENLMFRIVLTLIGVFLLVQGLKKRVDAPREQHLIHTALWIQLPLFGSYMLLKNNGNTVWLATLCTMILIYYALTQWRMTNLGMFWGLGCGWVLWALDRSQPHFSSSYLEAFAVVFFAWVSALLISVSVTSRIEEQLNDTLATMAILAHELRTPLAAVSLSTEALRINAKISKDPATSAFMVKLSDRLERLAQTMNRQIDTQIANARMMHVQRGSDRIDAAQLVARAVNEYPFQTPKERAVVRVHIVRNFEFTASEAQLMQVLFNLIKNAIHALHRGQTPWQEGGLLIRVLERQGRGLIQVIDKGAGIAPELLPHLFTPFVSTQKNMSHGLGLAFCKQVIEATEGRIHASSEPAMGTQFELDLPSDRPLQHNTLSDRF